MTPLSSLALFGSLLLLAILPGLSALTVAARTAAHGFRHGVLVTLGIITVDVLFILLAFFGLALLAQSLGHLFELVKILCGAYLLLLAVKLWNSEPDNPDIDTSQASALSSFLSGVLVTLGDQKAILFYFGFLPAFVDVSRATPADLAIVISTMIIALIVAKLGYAWLVDCGRRQLETAHRQALHRLSAAMMLSIGLFLLGHSLLSLVEPPA